MSIGTFVFLSTNEILFFKNTKLMETTNNKPKLTVKAKNLQLVFDYCIENNLKFSVSPRLIQDEWEFELNIAEIMTAVALGIFIKENKIEVAGLVYNPPKIQAAVANAKAGKSAKSAITKKIDLLAEASQMDLQSEALDLTSEGETSVIEEISPVITKSELAF